MKTTVEIPIEMHGPSKLAVPARSLYSIFLKYCDEEGRAEVHQKELAKILNYSTRQVRNLVRELRDSGLLRTRLGGHPYPSIYILATSSEGFKHCSFTYEANPEIREEDKFQWGNTVPATGTTSIFSQNEIK